ncbi:hypothetical protein EVAR_94960_1 [Eumeta japonica]|uniref:Uncharacterized protein n=1 Tax=Eumeta variegata TaxID=151549 RepID=A0A4C1UVS2_EUMVA|nr:hypothetical protein EVAR_94960_1 [Eumeta japonica]
MEHMEELYHKRTDGYRVLITHTTFRTVFKTVAYFESVRSASTLTYIATADGPRGNRNMHVTSLRPDGSTRMEAEPIPSSCISSDDAFDHDADRYLVLDSAFRPACNLHSATDHTVPFWTKLGQMIGSAWFQRKLNLRPQHRGVHLVTEEILKQVPELSQFAVGLCHIQSECRELRGALSSLHPVLSKT